MNGFLEILESLGIKPELRHVELKIARPAFGGIGQDGVNQGNHRGFHGGLLEFLKAHVIGFGNDLHFAIAEFLENRVVATSSAEALLQSFLDRRWRSQYNPHPIACDKLDLVDGNQIRWISHRNCQRRTEKFQGDKLVLLNQLRRYQTEDRIFDRARIKLNFFNAKLFGEKLG